MFLEKCFPQLPKDNDNKFLYYDRTDVSELIDINKTSESKEHGICHYWYFLDKRFKFQRDVCNGYHDVLMMSMILSDISILNINGANYPCIIIRIRKSETINLLQKVDHYKKVDHKKI